MWNKYTYHQSGGPLNRAYSMALNNSRVVKTQRKATMINCVKVIVEHNHKKLITPENALMVFGTNVLGNPQGNRGYGQTGSSAKIIKP
jgi:hypothetical protein